MIFEILFRTHSDIVFDKCHKNCGFVKVDPFLKNLSCRKCTTPILKKRMPFPVKKQRQQQQRLHHQFVNHTSRALAKGGIMHLRDP